MLIISGLLFAWLLCLVRAVNSLSAPPVVDLGYAQYQGAINTSLGIISFLGLRYAAAPTGKHVCSDVTVVHTENLPGNLRFQAPALPPRVETGVQLATTNAPACFQGGLGGQSLTNPVAARDDTDESEDCLFLSVYTPNMSPKMPLPTIVWIHGGGYATGSAGDYNGADIVQESNNNVVVVVIQYRLGLFGFLAGSQVKNEGALNAGLLDQQFALRWVNTNIQKFGGDPSQVTLWGESAGAGSVIQHMIANNGKTSPPLFRAIMTSSTFLPSQYPYDSSIPQALFDDVAAQAGCADTTNLSCLRAVDSATLATVNSNMIAAGFAGTFTFVPVVDNTFIMQTLTTALAQGKDLSVIMQLTNILLKASVFSVTNSNEGFIFVPQTVDFDTADYVQQLFPLLSSEQVKSVTSAYSSFGTPAERATAIYGESIIICPTYLLLNTFPGLAYKGEMAVSPGFHGEDILYYYPDFTALITAEPFDNAAFATAFSQAFVSFAANLNPNSKLRASITPQWSRWSPFAPFEMIFNQTDNKPAIAARSTSPEL
ncbi:Carboxylic ester hydrolase [Mycena sanguinolenta]|uniref:Carboxylic ester hydrolase n=1 Tax=Mycena sanguinolenta TaxID=230812 RepID=A0A8H6Y2K9_9AGAR|nr:Carboxylic ester hydrolase [Mycena sanguinolenta]